MVDLYYKFVKGLHVVKSVPPFVKQEFAIYCIFMLAVTLFKGNSSGTGTRAVIWDHCPFI
jgi:hypothetical protein